MSFRDNLQHLRSTRNMTQEQLAMLVGVSRQSVTKWEAEKAYPEMDKLLKLCGIFGCTLDELVSKDLTDRAPEPTSSVPAGPTQDVCGYDEHMRWHARHIALGIFAIIFGLAFAPLLDGMTPGGIIQDPSALSALGPLAGAAIGCALIIPASITHSSFQRAHPFIEDFYTADQRMASGRLLGRGIAGGIAALLLGMAAFAIAGDSAFAGSMCLFCAACGVGLIVYVSMMHGRTNVSEYNEDALDELSTEEVKAAVGQDGYERALSLKRGHDTVNAICGIIMMIATIVALALLFLSRGPHGWDGPIVAGRFFWLPWPIGGIVCGIVTTWHDAFADRKDG